MIENLYLRSLVENKLHDTVNVFQQSYHDKTDDGVTALLYVKDLLTEEYTTEEAQIAHRIECGLDASNEYLISLGDDVILRLSDIEHAIITSVDDSNVDQLGNIIDTLSVPLYNDPQVNLDSDELCDLVGETLASYLCFDEVLNYFGSVQSEADINAADFQTFVSTKYDTVGTQIGLYTGYYTSILANPDLTGFEKIQACFDVLNNTSQPAESNLITFKNLNVTDYTGISPLSIATAKIFGSLSNLDFSNTWTTVVSGVKAVVQTIGLGFKWLLNTAASGVIKFVSAAVNPVDIVETDDYTYSNFLDVPVYQGELSNLDIPNVLGYGGVGYSNHISAPDGLDIDEILSLRHIIEPNSSWYTAIKAMLSTEFFLDIIYPDTIYRLFLAESGKIGCMIYASLACPEVIPLAVDAKAIHDTTADTYVLEISMHDSGMTLTDYINAQISADSTPVTVESDAEVADALRRWAHYNCVRALVAGGALSSLFNGEIFISNSSPSGPAINSCLLYVLRDYCPGLVVQSYVTGESPVILGNKTWTRGNDISTATDFTQIGTITNAWFLEHLALDLSGNSNSSIGQLSLVYYLGNILAFTGYSQSQAHPNNELYSFNMTPYANGRITRVVGQWTIATDEYNYHRFQNWLKVVGAITASVALAFISVKVAVGIKKTIISRKALMYHDMQTLARDYKGSATYAENLQAARKSTKRYNRLSRLSSSSGVVDATLNLANSDRSLQTIVTLIKG